MLTVLTMLTMIYLFEHISSVKGEVSIIICEAYRSSSPETVTRRDRDPVVSSSTLACSSRPTDRAASIRSRKCMVAEVLAAENPEVENVKMTATQTALGSHSANDDGWTAIPGPLIECTRRRILGLN
ncbi:MAG: hypothetical protein ACLQDV_02755 [Candidatus Binataceae bacterium]